MTLQEVDQKIQDIQTRIAAPAHHPTEVYTRIVGYYRSVANWNPGKREEYNHRVTFDGETPKVEGKLENRKAQPYKAASVKPAEATAQSYLFFWRKTCPNCPSVKTALPALGLEGKAFNTDTPEGTDLAVQWNISTVPTVIFLDAQGNEIRRAHSPSELKG